MTEAISADHMLARLVYRPSTDKSSDVQRVKLRTVSDVFDAESAFDRHPFGNILTSKTMRRLYWISAAEARRALTNWMRHTFIVRSIVVINVRPIHQIENKIKYQFHSVCARLCFFTLIAVLCFLRAISALNDGAQLTHTHTQRQTWRRFACGISVECQNFNWKFMWTRCACDVCARFAFCFCLSHIVSHLCLDCRL